MKLELRKNMYYRTYSGFINKIISIKKFNEREYLLNGFYINKDTIKKASHNIIDLIEVGDYVNGDKIEYIDDCKGAMREFYYDYENPNDDVGHWQEEIKTIITHEQIEQMEYKVGD